ncbi:TSC22 domain family protein 3 isoform X2 [Hippoglossus hippoglossus]|uniref:TSC22 domain family protein 3 isoform X2 n=1 Tax=Hippoglossus hippoglossus TaxID=8267 RepID=UPI00148C219A|nr:TSC22 domain family protein 3 isoform X2 [Hippoglossus hippoglossus]
MSEDDCLSPIGLDCCSCCLDLANGFDDSMSGGPAQGLQGTTGTLPGSPTSPSVTHFRQLRNQLVYQNLNTDKLNNIMRQDSLESVVRDPCFLLNEGICNSNIDQTMLSILLFFHSRQQLGLGFLTVAELLNPSQRRSCHYTWRVCGYRSSKMWRCAGKNIRKPCNNTKLLSWPPLNVIYSGAVLT